MLSRLRQLAMQLAAEVMQLGVSVQRDIGRVHPPANPQACHSPGM
jgi:hypothetical protein